MKKMFGVLAVAVMVAVPMSAFASTMSAGEQYTLSAQKTVSGNLYIAAGTATIGGRVTGDLFAAGGTVTVSGSVVGDIAAGGGTIQVLGPVDGDVRVIGGTTTLNDRVGGDVVVLGGSLHVLPGAVVSGDLITAGGQVILDGTVRGSVQVTGGQLMVNGTVLGGVSAKLQEGLTIGATANISGPVSYSAPKQALIEDGARIAGAVSYSPSVRAGVGQNAPKRAMWALVSLLTGMKLLAALGLAALIVWRWRRSALDVIAEARGEFWRSLGRGVVYAVLIPVASVLLLISIIGTLPGILAMMGFAAMMIVAKALAGLFLGSWLSMMIRKSPAMHITWTSALGGVILLTIIGTLPLVGWLVSWVLCLIVFGVMAHRVHSAAWNA